MHARFLLAVLLMGHAAPLCALSLAPPPPPPIGWEERMTPGYEPPVEEVVVQMSRHHFERNEVTPGEVWKGWDAGAVQVLIHLLEDARWEKFRNHMITLLVESPHARAHEWAEETLREAGLQEQAEDQPTWLGSLLGQYAAKHPKKAEELRELFLEQGNAPMRHWALHQLIARGTAEALARAELLAQTLMPDANQRTWLLTRVEEARGHLRAQEPMDPRSEAEHATAEVEPDESP